MTIQTVEFSGRRFVILPEEDFQRLEREAQMEHPTSQPAARTKPMFAQVTPLKVPGVPASEILIRDRR